MRLLVILLLIPLAALAAEPAVRSPKKLVEIENITLSDGRKFTDVAVVSDTATTITLRHDGTVEKIEKTLLPAYILRRWPIDEAQVAKDKKAAEQKAQVEALLAEKKKKSAESRAKWLADQEAVKEKRRQQWIKDNPQQAAPKHDAADLARLRAEARAQELALSRDGVRVVGYGFVPARNALSIRLKNADDKFHSLEWRQLRALSTDGRVLEPLDVVFSATDRVSYDLDQDKERTFTVVFPSAIIAAVSWADRPDLGWTNQRGQLLSAETAIADAKERAVAARLAKKSGTLQSVDGQLVQK